VMEVEKLQPPPLAAGRLDYLCITQQDLHYQ